jgi:HPr kinase/phosphorylase
LIGSAIVATVHATAVAVAGCGVLILGSSGSGKSSLALGVITTPFIDGGQIVPSGLISDDQVLLELVAGRLLASPPATIAGQLEVRGLGIVSFPYATRVPVSLAVEVRPAQEIDRMPNLRKRHSILGLHLPLIAIDPSASGATARLYLAALQRVQE